MPMRSIPAWAGEPCRTPASRATSPVYPRVGGGTKWISTHRGRGQGLSPRGRGNRVGTSATASNERSIPAWAGEPTP